MQHSKTTKEEKSSMFARRNVMLGAVLASLAGAYGTLTAFALRFIFPDQPAPLRQRIFIGFTRELPAGASKSFTLPSGDQMILSNSGRIHPETGIPYTGFSNRCPHLGCRVHWEQKEHRFLCPCHQGIFSSDGVATSGPPAQADQKLKPYRVEIRGDAIFVVVEDA